MAGTPADLADCLPNPEHSEYLPTLEELLHIQLEFAWKTFAAGTGPQPASVESLLDNFFVLRDPNVLIRLLRQEFHCRTQAGDVPLVQDYQKHFPNIDLEQLTTPPGETLGPDATDDTATRTPDKISDPSPLADQATIAPTPVDADTSPPPAPANDLSGDQTLQAAISIGEPRDDDTTPSATPGSAPKIQLEGYEILGELGRGGMGVVYRARDKKLKRIVALKMVLSGAHADAAELERFQREAEAVAQLQHPNIVQIHDVGEHNGRPFFSLEFVEGGELADQIAGEPQPPEQAAKLIETLSHAIHFAHQHNIIHRDLKPANVLLTSDGQPKITDFGLAKRLEDDSAQTASGSIMGTPSYMAPEQAGGKQMTIGPQTDVYALGALLYCMLTGRPPFQSASVMDTVLQVLEQDPVPPRQLVQGLDRDLETITLKCLQKDPGRRYQSAEDVADELRRYQGDEPIQARPVSAVEHSWRWCRRNPAIAGLIAAFTLLLVVGASLFWERQQAAFATGSVDTLLQADTSQSGLLIGQLSGHRHWADPQLTRAFESSDHDSQAKLHAAMALLGKNPDALKYVHNRLLDAQPQKFQPIRQALLPHITDDDITRFWSLTRDVSQPAHHRFQSACALALFDPNNAAWQDPGLGRFLTDHLVQIAPTALLPWRTALQPIKKHLHEPLATVFRNDTADKQQRLFAADVLGEYLRNEPAKLFELLVDSPPEHFDTFLNRLKVFRTKAVELAEAGIAVMPKGKATESDKDSLAERQSNCAMMLMRMGRPDSAWKIFQHRSDPRLRSLLIHRVAALHVDSSLIISRLEQEQNTSARRALVLCLGEFDDTQLTKDQRATVTGTLLSIYRDDPDAGMHSAAEWLLRRWKQGGQLAAIDKTLKTPATTFQVDADKAPGWFINSQGQTFAIVEAGEFRMGSDTAPPDYAQTEHAHRRRIGRRFAIATKEVTRKQWMVFSAETNEEPTNIEKVATYTRTGDSPIIGVTWFRSAHFCNWLSEREGIPEDQWCYETDGQKQYSEGMRAKARFWELSGYRLPTEAEWEFACRAGATTDFFFGQSETLLPQYAWTRRNSQSRTWPVASLKPNDLGLFDTHGNAMEWCYDRDQPYPITTNIVGDAPAIDPVVKLANRSLRGGAFETRLVACRASFRAARGPHIMSPMFGFRLIKTMPQLDSNSTTRGPSIAGMTRSEAVQHLETLWKQDPNDQQVQSMLALAARRLAGELAGRNLPDMALPRFQQAAELYRAMAPHDADGLFDMAYEWAALLDSLKQDQLATRVLVEALAVGAQLQKDDPKNTGRLTTMAVLHKNLGLSSFKAGRRDICETSLKESRSILEQLVAQQPKNTGLRYKLAQTQIVSSDFYRIADRVQEGLVHQKATVESFQELGRLEPTNGKRFVDLAVQLLTLAEMYERLPDLKQAEHTYRAAESLFSRLGKVIDSKFMGNRIAISRLRIAELCLRRGDHAASTAMAIAVGQVTASHDPRGQRFTAASILAKTVTLAANDPKLKPEQRTRIAEEYRTETMKMLKQLEGRTFFTDPANVKTFRDEAAFKVLKNRDDYKALLKSLDTPQTDTKKPRN